MSSELDATYKLLAALELGVEKPSVEPLINRLPSGPAYYSMEQATVIIDKAGDAEVTPTVDGKVQPTTRVSFSDVSFTPSLPPGEKFSATVSEKGKQQHADLEFRWSPTDPNSITVHVSTDGQDGRVIDGTCSTQQSIIICNDETIKDAHKDLLLKAQSTSNMESNPDSFHIDTRYIDPKTNTEVGKIHQGIEIQDGQLTASTRVIRPSAE